MGCIGADRVGALAAAVAVLLVGARAGFAAPALFRHDLAVTLRLPEKSLAATDNMTIDAGGAASVTLRLAGNARILAVSGQGTPLPHSFRDGSLSIELPEGLREGERTVAVAYEARFDDPVPEDPVNFEDPGFGVTGTVSPRGVFLDDDAGWYPRLPGSRPTFHVLVDADEGIFAVTAGKLLRRETAGGRTLSEWETAFPAQGLALSAGRYVARERPAGDVALYTFFTPETDPLSARYLDASERFIDLYRGLLGPYPFEKFAVVENFFPTGYGFPSYTLLGSTVVRLPFIVDTSLGHEIAHSWWGNGVYVDYSRGNWCEGLTTYVADYLYKERESPAEGREYRVRLLREYATLVSPQDDIPLRDFTGRASAATRAVGYGKAAMVYHMVRRMIGDDAFYRGLRSVVREKMFQPATWSDFARAFAKESHVDLLSFRDGAVDLSSFFRQWVDRPGAPVLSLKDVTAVPAGSGWKIAGRLVQEKPYYELSVPLRLETAGRNVDATLPFNGREIRFALFADDLPRRLVVDPDVDLFRRLDPAEVPPIVNGLKGSGSLVAVAARGASRELLDAAKTVLESIGRPETPVLPEDDAPPASLADNDVLYIGLPGGAGRLPRLPAGLALAPSSFVLDGEAYKEAGDALFAVLPHPARKGRVCALFLAASDKAAAAAARKVTHYGKYSFLAFRDGVNKAKGTWPPGASPTVHVFRIPSR